MNTNPQPSIQNAFDRRQALYQMLGLVGLTDWAAAHPPELERWLEHVHAVASTEAGQTQARTKRYRPLIEGTKPKFFSESEFKTLSAVVEQIIPATDTPGALGAGVHWYLDIVVQAEPELQPRFRQGLALLDQLARQRFGRLFAEADKEQQAQVLRTLEPQKAGGEEVSETPTGSAGDGFFETVKAMTIVGYYSSEIGLYQELHWVEDVIKGEFTGCPHGGHPLDLPERPSPRAASAEPAFRWPFPGAGELPGDDL